MPGQGERGKNAKEFLLSQYGVPNALSGQDRYGGKDNGAKQLILKNHSPSAFVMAASLASVPH